LELGNALFGNSRGTIEITRSEGYEEIFLKLLNACDLDSYGIPGFENDTFVIRPYNWRGCSCGFDSLSTEEVKHRENCYQSELKRKQLETGYYTEKYGILSIKEITKLDLAEKQEELICKKLCLKHNIPWNNGIGSLAHCTCDFDKRYAEHIAKMGFPKGHKKDCLEILPNFCHKPSGIEIQWYKYPLRDSYFNKEISLEEFSEIIDGCISSINA
jgi:hypothetical protein